ncbi:hypothetical protein [Brevibacillus fulvus]|uniref:Uncharacterized protein n=1 Tax=Brevibacillus fulvus TaxID=1125967 RepID=A0A938Y1J9_9BACL|nr:hypothetical protein [Brevibacillus fulvus]MBM7589917.1 hypothetical protein [Brevibacillus fulvus]
MQKRQIHPALPLAKPQEHLLPESAFLVCPAGSGLCCFLSGDDWRRGEEVARFLPVRVTLSAERPNLAPI